jgi:hypothetical protein
MKKDYSSIFRFSLFIYFYTFASDFAKNTYLIINNKDKWRRLVTLWGLASVSSSRA